MTTLPACPACRRLHRQEGDNLNCPSCGHIWSASADDSSEGLVVRDANGNLLADGDSVTVVKDLKVKGSSSTLKIGTKVKSIRLVEGDHNIDCKIDGFGPMKLKSEFVKNCRTAMRRPVPAGCGSNDIRILRAITTPEPAAPDSAAPSTLFLQPHFSSRLAQQNSSVTLPHRQERCYARLESPAVSSV